MVGAKWGNLERLVGYVEYTRCCLRIGILRGFSQDEESFIRSGPRQRAVRHSIDGRCHRVMLCPFMNVLIVLLHINRYNPPGRLYKFKLEEFQEPVNKFQHTTLLL